jgi:hypothetical protein
MPVTYGKHSASTNGFSSRPQSTVKNNLRNLCNLRIYNICVNLRSSAVGVFVRVNSRPFAVVLSGLSPVAA